MKENINTFIFCFSILALYINWHYFWRPYLLDNFREKLFTIRDELFWYAAKGNISFDSQQYILMRDWINGALRFAHRITLTDIFLIGWMVPNAQENSKLFQVHLENIVESIKDQKNKEFFTHLKEKVSLNIGKYFFLTTPLLWIVFIIMFSIFFFHHTLKQSYQAVFNWLFKKIEPRIESTV